MCVGTLGSKVQASHKQLYYISENDNTWAKLVILND